MRCHCSVGGHSDDGYRQTTGIPDYNLFFILKDGRYLVVFHKQASMARPSSPSRAIAQRIELLD